jgi:hypothetical protein
MFVARFLQCTNEDIEVRNRVQVCVWPTDILRLKLEGSVVDYAAAGADFIPVPTVRRERLVYVPE